VHGVEYDHPFGDFGGVLAKLAAARIPTPNFEGRGHLSKR
jgi:hypothetical protein